MRRVVEALETAPRPKQMAALEDLLAQSQAAHADPGRRPLERSGAGAA